MLLTDTLAQITAMWHCSIFHYNYIEVLWMYKTTDVPPHLKVLKEIESQAMIPSRVPRDQRDVTFACSILGKLVSRERECVCGCLRACLCVSVRVCGANVHKELENRGLREGLTHRQTQTHLCVLTGAFSQQTTPATRALGTARSESTGDSRSRTGDTSWKTQPIASSTSLFRQ